MKKHAKKVMFLGLLVGTMALVGCNNGEKSSSKPSSSAAPVSTSSEAPVELPKYEVSIDRKDGSAVTKETVEHGTALTKPADPTAPAGKKFYGWMNTKNGGQIWDFDARDINVVMQDVALEPLFVDASLDPQAFEAELCPAITESDNGRGMEGATYSGGAKGKQLVNRAYDNEYKASGAYVADEDGKVSYATAADLADPDAAVFGAYVHFMYAKGDTLTFDLVSDAAAENVALFIRLSAEYAKPDEKTGEKKYSFTDEEFQVKVNGTAVKYGTITMHNVPETGSFLNFQDFFMSASLSLAAGANKIELVVNNDINLFSTIAATAPCVDCVKLYSTSAITWPNAKLANLERD